MKFRKLVSQWKKDEKANFKGWDFSYLDGRWEEESPPWDYMNQAKRLLKKSKSVVDIETGGGERFFQLIKNYKGKAVALEGYKPNVKVARKNLKRFGVKVVETQDLDNLPFEDEQFDLILNRHGAINVKEFYRILRKGGVLLTQQVSGDNLKDLKKFFGVKSRFANVTVGNVKKDLKKAGLAVTVSREWSGKYVFYDVGALVYYLKAIPFLVDGFSVDSHILYLKKLQDKLNKNGRLEFFRKLFLIEAKK